MASDRAFGHIEMAIRVHGDVHDVDDYCEIIRGAVYDHYEVVKMKREDFVNFDELRKYVVQRKPHDHSVRFKDARKFVVVRLNYREGYFISMDYSDSAVLHSVRLMPGKTACAPSRFNLSSIRLEPKYDPPLALQHCTGQGMGVGRIMWCVCQNYQI